MKRLTAEDIHNIHLLLEEEFPTMTKGVEKEGLVNAVIDKIERDFVAVGKDDIF